MFTSVEQAEAWIMGAIEHFFPTVHILKSGFPMCGFNLQVPGDWPHGNTWVSFLDPDVRTEATCKECLEAHSAHRPS